MSLLLVLFKCLFIAVQILTMSFLLQPFVLLLVHLIRKQLPLKKSRTIRSQIDKNFHFGVVVTAHRDTKFIHPIVDSLLKQTYPHFKVYVVADDCDVNTIPQIEDERVHILIPPVAINNNTKSIDYALKNFSRTEEVMVIFDPDNLVHPRFLEVINTYYNKGYKAVQGNMLSKNTDSQYEKIDSIGVIFNNFIDREIRSDLNFSVNTWGCGVSVKTDLYRKIKYDARSITGGFDKYMQLEIAREIRSVAYARKAIFYDEKINNYTKLEKQRSRWIRSYFKFLPDAFSLLFQGIKKLDFNLAFFGYNLIRPPYFLQILMALLFLNFNFFIDGNLSLVWFVVLLAFLFSLVVIIVLKKTVRSVLPGLWYSPVFFYHQIRALLKMTMNKNCVLKTENSKVLYIDDVLKHGLP